MFNKIIGFVGLFILIFQVSVLAQSSKHSTVTLQVSNPYKFDAEIEVKCDWDGNKYLFYQKLLFTGKEVTSVVMPSTIRNCELWPHINMW